MTFREFETAIDAWKWRMEMDLEVATIMAWRTAVWSRAKKIPSLDRVLKKMRRDPNKKIDPDEARKIGKMAEEKLRLLAEKKVNG